MTLIRVLLFCASSAALPGSSIPEQIAARLPPPPDPAVTRNSAVDDRIIATILERPDPETFFSRYVFALQREHDKLLTPTQARTLDELIARYAPRRTRWHDERNVLRCKFNEVMWRYAAAPDHSAAALRDELKRWMVLRMEWTLREHLLYHEQDAAVWSLLDATQRRPLLAGDWKAHARMTTGHQRENATARLIVKALGQPDHPAAFAAAVEQWRTERAPLHRRLMTAEHTARRVGFAMDVNSPALVERVTARANDAYATVYLAEADACRRLIRAGYEHPSERCAKAAAEAWAEAPKRFRSGASELIELLQNPLPSSS